MEYDLIVGDINIKDAIKASLVLSILLNLIFKQL